MVTTSEPSSTSVKTIPMPHGSSTCNLRARLMAPHIARHSLTQLAALLLEDLGLQVLASVTAGESGVVLQCELSVEHIRHVKCLLRRARGVGPRLSVGGAAAAEGRAPGVLHFVWAVRRVGPRKLHGGVQGLAERNKHK
eukprot:CAMPEP_0179445698 /NCGR_PEP_ID=MMETSP0799-20121207/29119_1 /TAXON_ID=46947 /ORGANISM="Geminigera cryophila, Strain CCMP2564" /LENGTH=138 /DNA_ID=CAMNT_0021233951 /DNA_START=547 /DNA_END=964 /DNA_ORIENTATION=+